MSNIDGKNSTNPIRGFGGIGITHTQEKVFVITGKGHLVDEQNREHPWYLFPEEDMDDFSAGSDSSSSYTSGDEEEVVQEEVVQNEKDMIKKEVISLEENIKIKKEDEKAHSCATCGKIYKKKGHLERHQLKHSGDKKCEAAKLHCCEHCGYQATCVGNYKKHMLTHSGERPFSCHLCEKSFRQKVHLKDHIRSHTGARDFECTECGATFVQKSSLKLHERKHSGIRPYSCNLCKRSFFENQHLVNHMRTHTGEKPYQCETCGQTFSTFRTLKTHKMIHTGERPYRCEICGVSFREKATLQKHKGVHINIGPFPCNECGKEFTRLASLTLHKKIHLQVGNNAPVFCGTSNYGYTVAKSKAETTVYNEENSNQMIGKESAQISIHKEQSLLQDDYPRDISNVTLTSQFQEEKSKVMKSSDKTKILFSSLSSDGESPFNTDFHKSGSSMVKKNLLDRSPRKSATPLENIFQKTPEKDVSSPDNIAHPDHVRQALEFGTIWETKDDDGNDLIVVLPAILSNRELILTSQNNETVLPIQNSKPSSLKSLPAVNGFKSTGSYEMEMSKEVIESEIPISGEVIHKFPKDDTSGKASISELQLNEGGHSSDDADLDIEIFTSSSVDDDALDVKSGGYEGRMIQEDVHSENTGLLLWDDDMGPVTEVTYVIEEGQKEPVSIFHNNTGHSEGVKVIPLKERKKRANSTGDNEFISGEALPKRRKREISLSDEKRKMPRRNKEKKIKPKRIFECKQCGKTCKSSSNFISHLRTHSGERPYYCDVCGVGFKQIAHLRSHIRIHTGEKPFVCDLCGASFTQSSRLNSHKRSRHVEGRTPKLKVIKDCKIRNFYCPICKKTFLDECFKRDHMEQHRIMLSDQVGIKGSKLCAEFQCDVCGIVYSNKATFNKHRLQHSDNKLICEVCGCSFANISALQSHSMVMHGVKMEAEDLRGMYINVKIGKEQDFIVVNPSVKSVLHGKNNLNGTQENMIGFEDDLEENHKTPVIQLTETSDGQVKSEVMQGSEFNMEEFSNIKVVHVNKGIKDEPVTTAVDVDSFESSNVDNYLQDYGNLKTSNTEDFLLNDSLDIKTSCNKKPRQKFDYINAEGKKIWECKVCNKEFLQSSNLHCHMRSHTGEKPYKCNVCPKAFKQITHLKEHMHKHTGMKSFGCGTCGAHFTQRGAVKRHISILHNGKGEIEKVRSFSSKRKTVNGNNGCLFVRRRSTKPKERSSPPPLKIENCDSCGKKYSASYMKSHLRCHTGEKPFKCKYCRETFRQKSHLKSHLIRHTGKRPFVCSRCGSSYMQSMRLKKHKEVCIGEEGGGKSSRQRKKRIRFKDMEGESDQGSEGSDHDLNDNDIDVSVPQKDGASESVPSTEMHHTCDRCDVAFANRKLLKAHEDICGFSSSYSELSSDSDDIPYQDDSDEEIVLSRKFRRKKMEKIKEEEPLPVKIEPSLNSDIFSKDYSSETLDDPTEAKTLDARTICKVCGAKFRRVSALNFHYKMKHEKANDDASEEDTDEENLRICNDDEHVRSPKSVTGVNKTVRRAVGRSPKGRNREGANTVTKLENAEKSCSYRKKRQIGKRKKVIPRGKLAEKEARETKEDLEIELFCSICNLPFEEASMLESHIENEHSSSNIRGYKENTTRKKQKRKVGSPTKVDFLCALDLSDKCENVEEDTKLILSDSCKAIALGEDEKVSSYVCNACGKSFTRSSKLKHHVTMWCKGKNSETVSPHGLTSKDLGKNNSLVDNLKPKKSHRKSAKEKTDSNAVENIVDTVKTPCPPDPLAIVEAVIGNANNKLKKEPGKSDHIINDDDTHEADGEESRCTSGMKKLDKETLAPFKCSKCEITFRKKFHLTSHLKKHKHGNLPS